MPVSVSIPKRLDNRGLRISRPARRTLFPSNAKLTARFAAMNVLPSPEEFEVSMMIFSSSFKVNWRFVRNERKTSSIMLFWFSCTTISALFFAVLLATGISAMIGRRVSRSTSFLPSILYLMNCIMRSITSGMASPTPKAPARILFLFGAICPVYAGLSISFPLSAVAASEIEFSSRFCRSMRYSPERTSCCLPISLRILSWVGLSCTCALYFEYCPSIPLRVIS